MKGIIETGWINDKLEGNEVQLKNTTDGRIVWKVVSEGNVDMFRAIREKDRRIISQQVFSVHIKSL